VLERIDFDAATQLRSVVVNVRMRPKFHPGVDMKNLVFLLACLAPLGVTACTSPETRQEVRDARTVSLVVSGMT
jgi:hypothetical protein